MKNQYLKVLFFMLLSIPGIVFSQDDSLPIEKRELFFGNSRIALQMVKVPGESYFVGRYYEGEYTVFLTSEIPDYTTFKRNGKGVTFYDNEFKFVMEQGTYKNDLLDGFGTYYKNQGNKIYEGNWKEGKRNGFVNNFIQMENYVRRGSLKTI